MTFRDKFKDILNSLELDDDRACGDPECCGETRYYISHESKAKAITAIFEAFKESLPKSCQCCNWEKVREEILKKLEE